MSSRVCAATVISQLAAQGVRDVVVAPGSRSAPLALAAWEAAEQGALRVHVRIDERDAGFLALGLARGSTSPVAVVTTSGTAVGNLLPAVMEASHAAVPLLIVSADRPGELVGSGANQTTDQHRVFGGFVRAGLAVDARAPQESWTAITARAVMACDGLLGRVGPVHLNVSLPEPLLAGAVVAGPVEAVLPPPPATPAVVRLKPGPRTVILCGDAPPWVGAEAVRAALESGSPLLAEPTSNARVAPALRCARLVVAGELGSQVERVVVFGHPTLSRSVTALLQRVPELVVVGPGEWPDPTRRGRILAEAVQVPPQDPAWTDSWAQADARLGAALDELLGSWPDPNGPALAGAVIAAGGDLVIGASQAIRDADLAAVASVAGRRFGNRGLAGIDGTVSTAIGIALAQGGPLTLLCGDLTFVHDLGGLVIPAREPRPDLRIVVADDNGGGIFAGLGYAATGAAFERVFATPTNLDLVAVSTALGAAALRVDLAGLPQVLARPPRGIEVVVVGIDRRQREELERRIADLATATAP